MLAPPRDGERTPLLAALGLAAALVLQFALPSGTNLPDDTGAAPRRPSAPRPTMVPDYLAVLRAPIFAPDRAPGEAAGGEAPATVSSLQLLGLAISGRNGSAVVRLPDSAATVLSPGQTLGGWKLLSVKPNAAVFLGPSGETTVTVGGPVAGAGDSPKSNPPGAPESKP